MRLCTAEQLFSFFHLITSQRNSLAFFPRVPIVRTKQRNKVSRPSERSVSFFFFLALLKIWRIGFPKSIPVFVFFCSTSNSSQQNKPLFFARDWELSCNWLIGLLNPAVPWLHCQPSFFLKVISAWRPRSALPKFSKTPGSLLQEIRKGNRVEWREFGALKKAWEFGDQGGEKLASVALLLMWWYHPRME